MMLQRDLPTPGAAPCAAPAYHAAICDSFAGFAGVVARLAVRSLHAELSLYPKPGLVSPVDAGSHTDMDAGTFMRSLFALRHYFRRICLAGLRDAPFAQLKQLGIDAEAAMLDATGGINTHRGAIFSLGMLCAAAGQVRARGLALTPASLRAAMLARWGGALAAHATSMATPSSTAHHSNGLQVARRYAVGGAREEGALGLPSVFEVGVPALDAALRRGAGVDMARTDALFALMAHVSDSNVYHRAGPVGADIVRAHAQRFLDLGGTAHPRWRAAALASHRDFVAQRLSPGGAADLLAASCLVHALCKLGGFDGLNARTGDEA
ncbi:MAG: triphosphoribosyl-dephospho-CoA synthase MdcB [Duganella sp.]